MFGHDDKNQQDNQDEAMVTPAAMDDMAADAAQDEPANDDQAGAPAVDDGASTAASTDDSQLLDIKRQALQQLQPLVGHLDQSPEEKFKTTMMMIQAADDKTLVQTAYDAAQAISDEKARAQALLDVINEINYFTHPQNQ